MHPDLSITIAGLAIGVLYGLFGVGSAFATPVLAMLGVPGMLAVVGPLPALLPGSASSAWAYARRGRVDWPVARRTLAGAVPAAFAGALAGRWVGGPALVVASGFVLFAVGLRVVRPGAALADGAVPWAHAHPWRLTAAAVAIGFLSGLLANGGGFLLVPLFLLSVGLGMPEATGTSLVVASALIVPTLLTHAIVGDIDWAIALAFGLGLVPGAQLGVRLAERLPAERLRLAFGWLLVGFASLFLLRQLL